MAEHVDESRVVGGRYVLRTEVGRGGMGRVWRADDTFLGREVAVKEVELPRHLTELERERMRARALREARAAARLHHPASLDVYDVVEEHGRIHLVMELVDAPNLAQVVGRNGPLPVEEAAHMGVVLLDALREAHRDGIVHRDVKPSNVMLPDDGSVRLADFGIASIKEDPSITTTGIVLGSPAYMAPEQAAGEPSGPPTDLWGLGATLYFAVEGEPPFGRGEPLPTMHAVLHEPPRPARSASRLEPVLRRLLTKDPARRPTPAEVLPHLRQVECPAPARTTALAALTSTSAGLHRRRNWALPAAGVAFAALALVAAVVGGDSGTPAKAGSTSKATVTTAPQPATRSGGVSRSPERRPAASPTTVATHETVTTQATANEPVQTPRPAAVPTSTPPSTIGDTPPTTAPSSPTTAGGASETP